MLLFNAKGPRVVPVEAFRTYQDLRPSSGDRSWSIKTLFEYATDEHHPTELRLLAWRDLLFQNADIAPEAANYYHPTHQHFSDLLYIDGGFEDGKVLRATLHGRPKLIRELSGQLEYNLRQGLMPRQRPQNDGDFADPDSCDQIIEILLPLVGETMARKLWKHHSCSTPARKPGFYFYQKCAKLCLPASQMPQWLTDHLWSALTTAVKADCDHIKRRIDLQPIYKNDINQSPALMAFIEEICHFDREHQTDLITKYVAFLESTLPTNCLYLDFFYLREISPLIEDELTTARLLTRHLFAFTQPNLLSLTPYSYIKDTENFLLWAHGFINLTRCNLHKSYIDRLSDLIATVHHDAKTSGKFRSF